MKEIEIDLTDFKIPVERTNSFIERLCELQLEMNKLIYINT